MSDSEIRELQRRLALLNTRQGRPLIVRPTTDYWLPEDPYDGEEITIISERSFYEKILAKAEIVLHEACGQVTARPDPEFCWISHGSCPNWTVGHPLIKLVASVTPNSIKWFSLSVQGDWRVSSELYCQLCGKLLNERLNGLARRPGLYEHQICYEATR